MYRKNKHIHFVGIGGIGMSGIAELLLNLGYTVSGSDLYLSPITDKLVKLGGTVFKGHDERWVKGANVVVTSSAISKDNPEVVQANAEAIPVIMRAEMLAELMRLKKYGIAIAGSHGKTSTTSMVSSMLASAGLDPTIVIGGKVDALGGNAKLGQGEFLVAEADESDGSFLKLSPVVEVVTNIDLEHLDYYNDIEHIKDTFLQFIDKIPFYGAAILCLDDVNIADILPQIKKRTLTYGLTPQADIFAEKIIWREGRVQFVVKNSTGELGELSITPPGIHNVYNALAAVCVGLELELGFAQIKTGLEGFAGVQRRMEKKGEKKGITVVDDYGHHPTEIKATLDAIKQAWPEKRLVVLFQPHRYSRTKALFKDFQTCFHKADVLVMCDIYAASEAPIEGVSSETLLEATRQHGQRYAHYLADVGAMARNLLPIIKEGDLVLSLGAGNIVRVGEELLELLDGPLDVI
ncbi:UDP-N-acetylmuramate--L-alanine ligase [Desulforhopalus sp. IMCC35007]|uniref:UDP-N-acetylmuramate--L-alanine ligase n=1 Tax=Desulforhopalus sp. IMCC35007 TaxID=2569543 RepID=UPI0010AE2846|nr:UDP-N-acetylmuramate--L-alanine ligase [Desulforhopalus sp. IMCC35007]TKB06255.1 UDP-N-acetylmuramate--L-alanine ligase [Desulforhopalus sp. IMCC35007]